MANLASSSLVSRLDEICSTGEGWGWGGRGDVEGRRREERGGEGRGGEERGGEGSGGESEGRR